MAKRATTDYSFIVGIDKPAGMTSHDVVDRCRRIYGERRIGHTGTLDPAATGALTICVGPATRLDRFFTGHDKTYEFSIVFGSATDTDDAEGEVIHRSSVPDCVFDQDYARKRIASIIGPSKQLPPVYSAIKVGGRKSYEAARQGTIIDLKPRDIVIRDAELLCIEDGVQGAIWRVRASVSAGTYVRSIARDMGTSVGTYAHVGDLRRIRTGHISVEECVSLEVLEKDPFGSILDPVKLLGMRFVFADEDLAASVANGSPLKADGLKVHCYDMRGGYDYALCACSSGVRPSTEPLKDGEPIAIVVRNELKAIYAYEAARSRLKSQCGFARGVKRGSDIPC